MTVCGSITTWIGFNPSYCVYELDKETLLPVSRKTYYFDVDEANKNGEPEWKLATDWATDFGMKDLSLGEHAKFAESIKADEALAKDYIDHTARTTDRATTCDETCRLQTYCESVTIDPARNAVCNGQPYYDWKGDFLGSLR